MADPTNTTPIEGQAPTAGDPAGQNDPSEMPAQGAEVPAEGSERSDPSAGDGTPIDWEAETRKARSEAAARRVELQELREQTKGAKSLDEVTELISAFETKVQAAELAAARERAGRKYGLPDAVVGRLQGDDEDAILADAEALAGLFTPQKQAPPAPLSPTGGRTPKEAKDELSPADLWAKAKSQL